MRISLSITLIALISSIFLNSSFAQTYTTLKTTTDKARAAFNEGRQNAGQGEYAIAQGDFEKALKADPQFIDARLALADNFTDLRDFFKAEKVYEEALAQDSSYAPVAYYHLARIEWTLDKYTEAVVHLEAYLRSNPEAPKTKASAKRLLASARFVVDALQHPVPFKLQSVGTGINTPKDEYFPCLTADGEQLIFTRDDGEGNGMFRNRNENFYRSVRKDSVWQKAEPLDGVNTNLNEGAQAISPDGTWLVFTACNRQNDGAQGNCDLYWSQEKSNGWSKPVPFSASINSPNWDSQPSISADAKTIIFASDRPGGKGTLDLWQTTRKPGNKWSKPENLPFNSGGKEHMPFFHPDGQTLYFTSDSLPGMGGNDLFFVRRNPDGTWGTPQNLGYPINTKAEEGGMSVSLDGRIAYFVTNQPGGQGGFDIYSFDLPEYARPQAVTYAKVQVTDAATGASLLAKLDIIDLQTGQTYVTANTRKDGTALACLPAGKDYAVYVNKDKYLFHSENFNLTGAATFYQPLVVDVALQAIPDSARGDAEMPSGAKPVVLRNVFFETGSAELRPESATELDRLVAILSRSSWLHIQINGHTDNVSRYALNQTLSEARAKSVFDYLQQKGVDSKRLKFKGFGETKPIDTNETSEGRAKNRRTEFVVW